MHPNSDCQGRKYQKDGDRDDYGPLRPARSCLGGNTADVGQVSGRLRRPHRFLNETSADALLLVVRDRAPFDQIIYPELDLHGEAGADGRYASAARTALSTDINGIGHGRIDTAHILYY